jgi:uncharacterized protein (TIRG00374 family)
VSDDLHERKRDEQDGVRAHYVRVCDPQSESYAQIENGIRNAVKPAQPCGSYAESPGNSSVVYVRERSCEQSDRNQSSVGSRHRESNRDWAKQHPNGREAQRNPSPESLMRAPPRHFLSLCAVLAIAWFAQRLVDWHSVITSIASASLPLVLLAAGATFLSTLIKGVRWWLFLRRSADLGVGHVVRLTIAGTALNSVLMANSGDVMRVSVASRASRIPVMVILGSLAADKLVEVMAFCTFAIAALSLQPLDVFPHSAVALPFAFVSILVLALLIAQVTPRSHSVRAATRSWRGYLLKGPQSIARFVADARSRLKGPDATLAYILSLVSWLAQIVTYAIGARAVGIHLPLMATVLAVVLVNIAGVLRLIPGNLGVFQAMFALAVFPYGVLRGPAVAAAALIQSVQLVSAIIAGLSVARLASGSNGSGERLNRPAQCAA